MTRAMIAARVGDEIHATTVHNNGQLSHVGMILSEYYYSQELAEKLISNGDIVELRQKCDKPKDHSYNNPVEGYTVYYGRDYYERDEFIDDLLCSDQDVVYVSKRSFPMVKFSSFKEALSFHNHRYNYLFDDGKWYFIPGYNDLAIEFTKDSLTNKTNVY